jgi:hypothetical protein
MRPSVPPAFTERFDHRGRHRLGVDQAGADDVARLAHFEADMALFVTLS